MDTQSTGEARIPQLKNALAEAVRTFAIHEAEGIWQELTDDLGVDPDSDDMLPPRVTIGIMRGRLLDMLCMLNNLGPDRAPGLKAICMKMLGDPLWERAAEEVETTSDKPAERESMRLLLEGVRGS